MYCDLVLDEQAAFRLAAGDLAEAVFYPAFTPLRDRVQAALSFELAPGLPWRWAGPGGPLDVSLTDVLAAVCAARLAQVPGCADIDPAAIRIAHEQATHAAGDTGPPGLAARLVHEQAEVAVPALVGEAQAADRLGVSLHSLHNLRLQYKTICAPVLIVGRVRTNWFWAPGQFGDWIDKGRPGRDWRKGRRGSFERTPCPQCGRNVARAGNNQAGLRPHKRPGTADWCKAPAAAAAAVS